MDIPPAIADPITQIKVRQVIGQALVDLPKDVIRAQTGTGKIGIEEGVDRRKTAVENVDDADHAQSAVVTELDQPGVDLALQ